MDADHTAHEFHAAYSHAGTCQKCGNGPHHAAHDAAVDRVASAINRAWNEFGEVPFPLYQEEAEALAIAAISAISHG